MRNLSLSSPNFSSLLKSLKDKELIVRDEYDEGYKFLPYFELMKSKWYNDDISKVEIIFEIQKK